MRVSISQPDVCRRNSTIFMPNEFRQAHSPADGLAVTDPGKRKVQLVQCRQSYTEKDRNQGIKHGSVIKLFSSQPLYRSCIHHEMPFKSYSTIMFLDKSLCMSLIELEERRIGQPTLHRSALSCRLGVSSRFRFSTDNKQAKTKEGYEEARVLLLGSTKHSSQEDGLGHCRRPLSKYGDWKTNCKADDSDTQRHRTSFGLLSVRRPVASNVKAGRRKGNADEAACSAQSNFRHRQHTFSSGSELRTGSKQVVSNNTDEKQEDGRSTVATLDKTCHYPSRLKDSVGGSLKSLSLKEALELFRPDFISRSQGRVRRLEQRAWRRKALQDSNPDLVQGLREDRGKQKRNCTTPDPLSDNLFKPRERSISGKEMQLRSRRIYNKLPEVTKKKEEEKKRAVSQNNRLRAEVFKKVELEGMRLLDQILQR